MALAHTIQPTPADEPATLVYAISELIIFDDSLALAEYDVPENRFRQLAYSDNQTRPIHCILTYLPLPILTADDHNHVCNMEFEVRFENAESFDDTSWCYNGFATLTSLTHSPSSVIMTKMVTHLGFSVKIRSLLSLVCTLRSLEE
jgi:hypothetical protein